MRTIGLKALSIIAVILLQIRQVYAQTDQDYCVQTKQWDLSDVKKVDPFKDLQIIRLISFEGDPADDLPGIPKDKDRSIAMKRMKEVVDIVGENGKRMVNVLFNYDYDPEFKGVIETTRSLCCIPRNAILFIDGRNEVIGYIEICFECQREQVKVAGNSIGGFCYEKFVMVRAIFEDAGVKYGVSQ